MKNFKIKTYFQLLFIVLTLFVVKSNAQTIFTDTRDSNVYQIVTIGKQVWMAENLRYLPNIVDPFTGSSMTPYYYVYDYKGSSINEAKNNSNYATFGVLYNWSAAMQRAGSSNDNPSGVQGVCPVGWHLPSDKEWTELINFLGGLNIAGGKLKETLISHWHNPNNGATNEVGFSALPGGLRYIDGKFIGNSAFGYWWSCTGSVSQASYYCMSYNSSMIEYDFDDTRLGFSVRCVKNND